MATLPQIPCRYCEIKFQPSRKDHKLCSAKCRTKEHTAAKRKALADIKVERGCCKCGFNSHSAALQFDHINQADKSFNIGWAVDHRSMQKLLEEVDKCRVLCANCHAISTQENDQHRFTRMGTT